MKIFDETNLIQMVPPEQNLPIRDMFDGRPRYSKIFSMRLCNQPDDGGCTYPKTLSYDISVGGHKDARKDGKKQDGRFFTKLVSTSSSSNIIYCTYFKPSST